MSSKLLQVKGTWQTNERLFTVQGFPVPTNNGADYASLVVTPGNAQITQRNHIFIPPQGSANAIVQVAVASTPFQKAYFYGVSAVSDTGGANTANTGTIYVGEEDPQGNIYCIDPVTNDLADPVSYLAVPGEALDLINFWVRIATEGDGALITFS